MIRYEVRYQIPYNNLEWRSQWFNTLDEAERMMPSLHHKIGRKITPKLSPTPTALMCFCMVI